MRTNLIKLEVRKVLHFPQLKEEKRKRGKEEKRKATEKEKEKEKEKRPYRKILPGLESIPIQ